jgi:hypothetical protein
VETDDAAFNELIEKSSLGTPGARQLRARTPQSDADVVRQIINLRNAMAHGNDHETAAAANTLLQLLGDLGYEEQVQRVVAEAFPGRQAEIIMTMARLIAHSREAPQQEAQSAPGRRRRPRKASGPGADIEESPGQGDLSAGSATSGFINSKISITIWWEPRNPNVIKLCTGDPRFVNDEGGRPGLWISIKRTDRNNWNRLARALAAAGQPAPPLVP